MSNKSKYKGVIFDLDQTLANTEDYCLPKESCQENCEQYAEWHLYEFLRPHLKIISWNEFETQYQLAKSQVKMILKGTAASHNRYLYIQRTLENLGVRFSPELVYNATNKYWDHILTNMKLFPKVLETLKRIKESHFVTAVLSDLTADIQIQKLSKLKINKYIDLLITSEEANADKPDIRPFTLALEKMNMEHTEVLMVGNNPKTDIAGSEKTKIDSVLFDFNIIYPQFAGRKISDFEEILDIISITQQSYSSKKLVIFDLMGTITTDPHLIRSTLSSVLKSQNVPFEYHSVKEMYEKLKVGSISDAEFWNGIGIPEENHQGYEDMLIDKIEMRQEAPQIIKNIQKKSHTAVLSNIPSTWGRRIAEKFNLDSYFDALVFSGDYKTKKPDSKLYKIVLSKFPGVNPAQTYIVDNELGDLKAAKHHIMNTIWLEVEDKDTLYVPDFVVGDLNDILKILAV